MATFKISDFKSYAFTDGGLRPTAFDVEFTDFPGNTNSTAGQKLSLLAKATSLPASIIPEIEVGFKGRKIKVMGDRIFPNWTMSIYCMENLDLRNLFVNWHELMNSRNPNLMETATTNPNEYKRDFKLKLYSKAGMEKQIYTIVGAFPTSVGPISLDWDATNQIAMFDVELAYDYWQPVEDIASTDGALAAVTLNPGQ